MRMVAVDQGNPCLKESGVIVRGYVSDYLSY